MTKDGVEVFHPTGPQDAEPPGDVAPKKPKPKKKKKVVGFNVMEKDKHLDAASKGGKSSTSKRDMKEVGRLGGTQTAKNVDHLKRIAKLGAEARWGIGYLAKKRAYVSRVEHVKWVCPDKNKGCIRCKFETHDPWFKCVNCGQVEGNLDKSCKGKR